MPDQAAAAGTPETSAEAKPASTAPERAPAGAVRLIGRLTGGLLDWAAAAPWRGALLVALIAAAIVLPGLTELPVTDRDEGRFVQASKQMMQSGDLIDIRFQDEPRWKKPVGIYWLQALAATPFGGAEAPLWAYRLPSAIAAILAALLTVWAARPLTGPREAVLSGLILCSTVLAATEANIAKTDAALMLTAVAAFGALARVLTGKAGRADWLIFWLAIAAAILIKGPVVPVISAFAVAWTALLYRRWKTLSALRPLPGVALTLLLVAPWLVAIWIVSDGAFFAEAVGRDLLGKVVEAQEKHGAPPGLYLAIVWLTFWPWAAFLPAAVRQLWRERRLLWAGVIAGWVLPFWLVLELVPTKLPHYVLPLYPALAMAAAAAILRMPEEPPALWRRRVGAALVFMPGMLLALAAVVLPLGVEGLFLWPAALLALAAAVFVTLAGQAALDHRPLAQAGSSLLAAAFLYPALLHHALPALSTAFPSPRMAAMAEQYRPCASGPLISIGYREPSLVFLTETGTRLITPEEAAEALRADPGAMVLVESRWRPRLDEALGTEAPALAAHESLTYFNYNRGKTETATLLTQDDPRWEACRP